ncbi:MAG: hypothetical protein AB7S86_06910 [Hydrogenophaga sp.]|uniref:hypothetical protein n=1 Tax=Hydrogenophaga sp. TaxID=1904254 RepID=UPI003D0AB7AB
MDLLFSRNPWHQSIAHWAAANDRSDVLVAIAAPLATRTPSLGQREALRRLLMQTDEGPMRKSPAHVASACGRLGMLRLYAHPRLGISAALEAPDATGNNVAHQWVLGGRSVQDLHGLARHMQLPRGHSLQMALTRRNGQGLLPADMSREASPVPEVRPAAQARSGDRSTGPSP